MLGASRPPHNALGGEVVKSVSFLKAVAKTIGSQDFCLAPHTLQGCFSSQRPNTEAACSQRARSSAVKAAGKCLSMSSSPTTFFIHENGDDDFGFCFDRAGEVARVGVDVVHDDGLSGRGCCTTDPLVEWDARVWSHGAAEGPENEHVRCAVFFEHVETHPVVAQHFLMEKFGDAGHQVLRGASTRGEGVEFFDQLTGFRICGRHREKY